MENRNFICQNNDIITIHTVCHENVLMYLSIQLVKMVCGCPQQACTVSPGSPVTLITIDGKKMLICSCVMFDCIRCIHFKRDFKMQISDMGSLC